MAQLLALAVLIGASQCIFLSALLLFGPTRREPSDRCLGWLVVVWAYTMLIVGWWAEPTWRPALLKWSHLAGTVAPLPFLFGPLVYGHVYFLMNRRDWRRRDAWHLAPFAVFTLMLMPFYLEDGEFKRQILAALEHGTHRYHDLIFWVRTGHGVIYTVAAWRLLPRRGTSTERSSFAVRWARVLTAVILGLYSITAVLVLAERWIATDGGLPIGEIAMVYLTVAIQILAFWRLRQGVREVRITRRDPTGTAPTHRYQKSGLSRERAVCIMDHLARTMRQERLFSAPDLGLADLAGHLGESPHHISQALNQVRGQSLAQYLSELRCRDAAARLQDPSHDHLTVLAIGLRAGFGSKATFNRVFKRVLGTTPSAVRSQREDLAN